MRTLRTGLVLALALAAAAPRAAARPSGPAVPEAAPEPDKAPDADGPGGGGGAEGDAPGDTDAPRAPTESDAPDAPGAPDAPRDGRDDAEDTEDADDADDADDAGGGDDASGWPDDEDGDGGDDASGDDAPDADGPPIDTPGAEDDPDDAWDGPAVELGPLDDGVAADEEGRIRYLLEDVRFEGDSRVRLRVLRGLVPFERGDVIDPSDDALQDLVFALRATGWFSRVQVRLERGSARGRVDLVVAVDDRNTVTVQNFNVGVSEGLSSTRDRSADVLPYVGFGIADSNVVGSGMGVTMTGLMSSTQQALRIGFQAPEVFGSSMTLRLSTALMNGREFYGNQPFVSWSCGPDSPLGCPDELDARNVVVFYRRASNAIGVGRTIGTSVHWAVDWVTDTVFVTSMPEAASEVRGGAIVPIDFAIDEGRQLVSTLRLSLAYDRRDDPNLTRRGVLVRTQADVGSRFFGSRFDYSRLTATVRGWVPLPRRQGLRFSGFLGVVAGDAPFYALFHVSDLSDLIPSRVLELDIDRRPARNFLGTSIGIMRAEEFAARVDVQYEIALQRGRARAPVRGVDGYVNLGLFALSDVRELSLPAPGYHGFSRFPVDLTFDVGVRIDTDIGLFEVGFSNLLGFIDLR